MFMLTHNPEDNNSIDIFYPEQTYFANYSTISNQDIMKEVMLLDSYRLGLTLSYHNGSMTTTDLHNDFGFNRWSIQCLDRNLKDECPVEVKRDNRVFDSKGRYLRTTYTAYLKKGIDNDQLRRIAYEVNQDDQKRLAS